MGKIGLKLQGDDGVFHRFFQSRMNLFVLPFDVNSYY
jgi:hypothetical protein